MKRLIGIATMLVCAGVAAGLEWPWYRDSNWWLVIIAALTGAVIGWQSWETRRVAETAQVSFFTAQNSLKLQEDTAKRQLRAYMVVRNSRLILHEDGFVEAKIELANCGQTPAYDLRGGTLCRFTVYPIRNVPPMPKGLRQSQSTIGAGLAFHLLPPGGRHDNGGREHLIGKLSADNGNLVYCVNGYYTYRDIFKDSHWLKFQLIVGGPSGIRVDSDGAHQWASFSNDSEGNEED